MKHSSHLLLLLTALVFAACSFEENETNTLTKKEIKKGWQLLMDGKSLANWKTYNGGEVTGWKIENGVLQNSGEELIYRGDIITKDEYQDFELYLEWKIAPESNSGIFFHVQEGIVNAIHESGPEYQIIDDEGWPEKLEPSQRSGANYGMHPPKEANALSPGEWNTTRLVVHGPRVQHWLNGKKVVEYELWSDDWQSLKKNSKWKNMPHYGTQKTGHIGLQDHGGLIHFRNIKIRKLEK